MLENQFDALNDVFMSLAKTVGGRLAVWCILDHYKTEFSTNYKFDYKWLQQFSNKYMERFLTADVFENDFYISVILKPDSNDTLKEAVRELEEIQQMTVQGLRLYECEVLSMYQHIKNIGDLMTRINTAQDPGDKLDLSNRLAVEQATVQANMQAMQAYKEISEEEINQAGQEARREWSCMQFRKTGC
jgi:type IV secretory pathway VirB4 component